MADDSSKYMPTFRTTFERIIKSRKNLTECPVPLWKLKVSDSEYEKIKERLAQDLRIDEPFKKIERECCLYFAEFWRREYLNGHHTRISVLDSLLDYPERMPQAEREDLAVKLLEAAKRGAQRLKVPMYGTSYLHSLLYQGGLPIQNIITPDTNTKWDMFAERLVLRNVNFDDLEHLLGIVGRNTEGMREFCTQLCDAVESNQFMKLPFWVVDENDVRFVGLKDAFRSARRNLRSSEPFTLEWLFDLNTIEHSMSIKYDINADQQLPKAFLTEYNLLAQRNLEVVVEKDSDTIATYNFRDGGYSHYRVHDRQIWHEGEIISVSIRDPKITILQQTLDLDAPQVLYRRDDGLWVKGNRIGSFETTIIVPQGWEIADESQYNIIDYSWEGKSYSGIRLAEDHTEDVVLKGPDGLYTIGASTALYQTEIANKRINLPLVKESVYDLGNVRFRIQSDTLQRPLDASGVYRNLWDSNWVDTPAYGKIFAKAIHPAGEFVSPIQIINVGTGLKIAVKEADSASCRISVIWPHGQYKPVNGAKLGDGTWSILKSELEDPRYIPIDFTPAESPNNRFRLHVKAPFKDFFIYDSDGNLVTGDALVPYGDLRLYTYHVSGMELSFRTDYNWRKLFWTDSDHLWLSKGHGVRSEIPNEGTLADLLDADNDIRKKLDKTAGNIIDASVSVTFDMPGGEKLALNIKDAPYRIEQEGNHLFVIGKDRHVIDYKKPLLLYKLDDPQKEPLRITYDAETGYTIPDDIQDWGKVIVTGRSKDKICPTLIEYGVERTLEERIALRDVSIRMIKDELGCAVFHDSCWQRVIGWMDRLQDGRFRADSLLDLWCVARSSDALIKLAFQLYLRNLAKRNKDEENETLQNQLIALSEDLAFQWWWLLPRIQSNDVQMLESFIGNLSNIPNFNLKYEIWTYTNQEKAAELEAAAKLMQAAGASFQAQDLYLFQVVIPDFFAWMVSLARKSMDASYDDVNAILDKDRQQLISFVIEAIIDKQPLQKAEDLNIPNSTNQTELPEVREFFEQYLEREDWSKSLNERWFIGRVRFMAKAMTGKICLFDKLDNLNERLEGNIRRSLVYCYMLYRDDFVLALNNAMIDAKKQSI